MQNDMMQEALRIAQAQSGGEPVTKVQPTNAEIDHKVGMLRAQMNNVAGMLTSVGSQMPEAAQARLAADITHFAKEIAALEAQRT